MAKLYDPTSIMSVFAPTNAAMTSYRQCSQSGTQQSGEIVVKQHIVLDDVINATTGRQAVGQGAYKHDDMDGAVISETTSVVAWNGKSLNLKRTNGALERVSAPGQLSSDVGKILRTSEETCAAVVHIVDYVLAGSAR